MPSLDRETNLTHELRVKSLTGIREIYWILVRYIEHGMGDILVLGAKLGRK
jgi:hypothetical protein